MINKFIRFSIFTPLLLLSAKPVLAQPYLVNGYHVEHFTDENGLPQNSINDLLFDHDGFLWLASQAGLIRFDGSSFKVYAPADRPAMESNFLILGKNSTGSIYCQATENSLYCHSAGDKTSLNLVNAPGLMRPLLLNSRKQLVDFTSFLQDRPSANNDPAVPGRMTIFNYLFEHNDDYYAIDSSHIYLIYKDTLYYYGDHTLSRPAGFDQQPGQYLVLDKKLFILRNDSVKSVFEDGRRISGAAPIKGDLLRDAASFGQAGKNFTLFTGDGDHLLIGKRLYRISKGPDGLTTRFLVDLDFINHVSAIAYDPELDLLLVGSQTEGFYFLRKSRFGASGFPPDLQSQLSQYLFGPIAWNGESILTDKFLFDASGKFNLSDRNPVWQKCLYVDQKKNVWGSNHNIPRKMTADMKAAGVFPALDRQIIDYREDGPGNLFCLTERSVWRLDGDSFRSILKNERVPAVRGINEAFSLVGPHRLWIANTGGLIEFDPVSGMAKSISDLHGAHVRSIYPFRDGSVLLGTYGQGYYYYHHDRFYHMPLDKNGFLITAHCFMEDNKGAIWIPCNKGLFKVPRADMDAWCDSGGNGQLYYYYYGRQDGLMTNEFNGGFNASGVITPEGFMVLLSMKGMVCFYSDSLKSDFPGGPVDITDIEIDGKTSEIKDTIELPAGYNNLVIVASCPFLGNRNNLYLEYCLKGLNSEWKELAPDGTINLSRLQPGNYTLQVRKVNGFGRNNFSYKEWNIAATPHFYQTAMFRAAFVVILLLLVLLLVFFLVESRMKLKQKQKEVRVKAKALLQTSKMKEKLISLVIHDLRSPIRFLSMLAKDLHDNQDGFSAGEIRERTYWIKKGANDLHTFSEDFLLWVTSQKNNFSISKRQFLLRPLLQEMEEFFREQLQQKGNSLCYDAPEELSIYSDPHILITIIRNLVDNANKYTGNGKIMIRAVEEDADILISISDTGKGMSREQVAAFLQKDNIDGIRSGSQLGHTFILDLTKKMNGTVSVESREQQGTKILLRFSKG